jgi:HAD superfamily hydrolase (TIGR01484 family)
LKSPSPIQLIVLDIDGVLSEGEGRPLDLELLGRLSSLNRAARATPAAPAVTLCSGRPAPYLEVMMQAIDAHLPGIFENGAGLYYAHPYSFLPHPALAGSDQIPQVREALDRELIQTGRAFIQPGKLHTLTLFAEDPAETRLLAEWAEAALGPLAAQVDLVYSTSCLNVLPHGIDKGLGVGWLAERTGIPLEAMLGVGDSDVDLSFLQRVGHSAAPSNANASIRAIVDYTAPHPTASGVRDILAHYGLLA